MPRFTETLFTVFFSLALSVSAYSEDIPKTYRHAITFVHPHASSNPVVQRPATEPQQLQATNLQLPQATDFGLFRLQYNYQNLFGGFSPWVALGGNLHRGFLEYPLSGTSQLTVVHTKVGLGLLAGMQYRYDLLSFLYMSALAGYGHYFSSQIDIDFPQTSAAHSNGCHEVCVTGDVDTILYGALVGFRILPFLAFELGLEHNLFFSRRYQSVSDGISTVTTTQGTAFSDALMFSFGFTLQFNL